jgi:hypothetical protein
MGQLNINGALSTCPDPASYILDGFAETGAFCNGAPVIQGKESGTLTWPAMSHAAFIELWAQWNTNKGNHVSGKIPEIAAGSLGTYDSVTAYFHEPTGEVRNGLWHNVRMPVSKVTR